MYPHLSTVSPLLTFESYYSTEKVLTGLKYRVRKKY